MWDVMVVGDTAQDLIVRPSRPGAAGSDVPAVIASSPGGQGSNIAWAAAAAGASTALVTQVGTDSDSRNLVRRLRSRKIALPGLLRQDPLTRVVALVASDGERALMTQHGVGPVGEPAPHWKTRSLVLSGYVLARGEGSYVESWLRWAGQRHVPVWADLGQDRLPMMWAPYAKRLYGVAGGMEEWHAFSGALGTSEPFGGVVLLKMGPQGALLLQGGSMLGRCSAMPDISVVDTTGAGDALLGTLVGVMAVSPETWQEALAHAVRAAERVVGQVGAVDAT